MSSPYINIFIWNLDDSITDQDLKCLFYNFGKIVSTYVKRKNGRNFGFVCFEESAAAAKAYVLMHKKVVGSKTIFVDYSIHKPLNTNQIINASEAERKHIITRELFPLVSPHAADEDAGEIIEHLLELSITEQLLILQHSTELKHHIEVARSKIHMKSLPRAIQYEKSFMHRDTVTHVFATKTDFIITASIDGHLKFWKKIHKEGVEFVKHFRCHMHPFSDICVNYNGTLMATVCTQEKTVKVFDIANFDMINMFKYPFSPKIATWVHLGSDLVHAIAVSDANSPKIFIYDGKGENVPIHLIENLHTRPIALMEYVPAMNVTISIDERGMLEYWSGAKTNYEFPMTVKWDMKASTDLYEFFRRRQPPNALAVSPTGNYFATFSHDRSLKIFSVAYGKIVKVLDESLTRYIDEAKLNERHGLLNVDWTRKVALEKDINKDPKTFDNIQISFDESGNFVVYPSPLGLRIYNIVTEKVMKDLGKPEAVRFMGAAICRAMPTTTERLKGAAITAEVEASENSALKKFDVDPMIIATAYKKNRFYIFTNCEPFNNVDEEDGGSNRDVFNENPRKEDALTTFDREEETKGMTDQAIIHTTFGDIHVKLFPKECPKAVENFVTHARRGYYNGHCFHRVIKSFIIQTGDPTGRGTGGQSIWGADFEDEFHPMLRHDKPFRLSMANAGPNTNGSRFFFTVVPAEFLDGKNTLFGEVTDGFSVVQKINQVPTYEKSGRPRDEINIVSITLKN